MFLCPDAFIRRVLIARATATIADFCEKCVIPAAAICTTRLMKRALPFSPNAIFIAMARV